MREEIRELTNDELSVPLDELAGLMREELESPRCAEMLNEAAKRLRERK